MIAPVV